MVFNLPFELRHYILLNFYLFVLYFSIFFSLTQIYYAGTRRDFIFTFGLSSGEILLRLKEVLFSWIDIYPLKNRASEIFFFSVTRM